jgi:anti-sigma regulatory factor (Ser/Thr protein kinase)/anti-anti-sigma regulatory factor
MSRLQCELESDGQVSVARLDGRLGLADAPIAWNALVKLLAEQPDALLIDLTGLTCDDAKALLVLGALARRASLWPGVPVIASAPRPRLREEMHRLGLDRLVAVCSTGDEARVLAHSAPAPPRLRLAMLPQTGAARRARDLATEACLRWDHAELIAPASVVASELVTNAVKHAGTRFELTFAQTPRYLHVSVRDEDPRPAVRQNAALLALGGRGLQVVEQSTLTWGSTPAERGKVVWATLSAMAR